MAGFTKNYKKQKKSVNFQYKIQIPNFTNQNWLPSRFLQFMEQFYKTIDNFQTQQFSTVNWLISPVYYSILWFTTRGLCFFTVLKLSQVLILFNSNQPIFDAFWIHVRMAIRYRYRVPDPTGTGTLFYPWVPPVPHLRVTCLVPDFNMQPISVQYIVHFISPSTQQTTTIPRYIS
jgi:hypothetical protein